MAKMSEPTQIDEHDNQHDDAAAIDAAELLALADDTTDLPPDQQPPPPTVQISNADILRPVVALVCRTFAPKWGISDTEQNLLAEAYGDLCQKYFGDLDNLGVELTALTITAAVVMPRMDKPRFDEPEPQPEPEPEQGADDAND